MDVLSVKGAELLSEVAIASCGHKSTVHAYCFDF
jgi:hypothetical protein